MKKLCIAIISAVLMLTLTGRLPRYWVTPASFPNTEWMSEDGTITFEVPEVGDMTGILVVGDQSAYNRTDGLYERLLQFEG